MKEINYLSVSCSVAQRQALHRLQQLSGCEIKHHDLPEGLNTAESASGKGVVFVGWDPQDPGNSARTLSSLRQTLNTNHYLIAVSPLDSEREIVSALGAGADRFVQNEVATLILKELILAITRRQHLYCEEHHFPPYIIHQATREIGIGNRKVQLSRQEFLVTQYFFENNGYILARSTLMKAIWGLPDLTNTRRVDTKISRIRKKIKLDGTHGWSLENHRGLGYKLSRAPVPEYGQTFFEHTAAVPQ